MRIIATILIGLSIFPSVIKTASLLSDMGEDNPLVFYAAVLWSLCWRAFVIATLWVI